MDFQTLGRRDLQALCKRNRIPANMTNTAMADALRALSNVEGIAEIQEAMQYQSPKKSEATSPEHPRTGRRTSARRVPPSWEEPRERQASPLPRSRRVTADVSEIMMMVAEGEGPEDKHDAVLKIPPTPVSCAGQKTRVPATRRRVSNKEVAGVEMKEEARIPPTPVSSLRPRRTAAKVPDTPPAAATATRSVRKTAVCRVAETPKVEVKEEKASVQRRTRQPSSKKIEETAAATATIATTARRSTRAKAVPKMASLGPEAEEQEVAAQLNAGRKSARSNAAVKIESLVKESKEQEGKDVAEISDLCPSDPIQEPLDSDDVVHRPVIRGVADQEDSPIKGLVEQGLEEKTPLAKPADEGGALIVELQPSTEKESDSVHLDFHPQETPLAKPTDEGGVLIGELQPSTEKESDSVHLDFHPQETPFGDESAEEMVASVDHQLPTDEPKTDDVPAEADIPIDVPVCGDSLVGLTPNVALEAEIELPFNENLTSPAVSPVKGSSEVEPILTGEVAVESDSFEQEIVAPATETEVTLVETKAADESESTILSDVSSPVKESSVLDLINTDETVQELETNAPMDDSLATATVVETKASRESESITLVETKAADEAADESESTILSADSSPVKESSVLDLINTDETVQELKTNAPMDDSLATAAVVETKASRESESITLNVISSPLVLMPDVCLDSTSSPMKESIELELEGSNLTDALSESSPFQLVCSPRHNGGSLATFKETSVGVSELSDEHDKENKDAADGEVKKSMAKKQHPVHYSQISLRKLKSIYKEKLISKKDDHKVKLEVKRTALTALDENSL